jgi:uncharacterized membrane protein
MAVANGDLQASSAGSRSTTLIIGFGLLGAALYAFSNWTTFHIDIPGTTDVSIRPQYALLTFFGFAFGPMVGLITGLFGNLAGDWLSGFDVTRAWPWSVANGLVGLLTGVGAMLVSRSRGNARAMTAGVASVVATVIGFGFIWIELVTQPELGAQHGTTTAAYILSREYLPTVIVNSVIAAIATPILVLAWEPLREHYA